MGPSSGIGFAAKVLQEVLQDEQPQDPDFYYLFSLDDFARSRALENADGMLVSELMGKRVTQSGGRYEEFHPAKGRLDIFKIC